MKIYPIFEDKLYSIIKNNESYDELKRLIIQWSDAEFLYNFYKRNKDYFHADYFGYNYTVYKFLDDIEEGVQEVNKFIEDIQEIENIESFFINYSKSKSKKIYSLQKKRFKLLRLYAAKIKPNVYIILGGTIKVTKKTQNHPITNSVIEECNNFLKILNDNKITDSTSLSEFVKNNYKL